MTGEQTPHSRLRREQLEKEDEGEKEQEERVQEGLMGYKQCKLSPENVRNIPLPKFSWADSREVATLMCFKEDVLDKDRDPYLFKHHTNLTARMRAILFEWLMEVISVIS